MKPVLYVGLRGICGGLPWGKITEANLILVTSEKGTGYRQQVYGRSAVDGIATHCKGSDIVAKFPDMEKAKLALGRAAIAHDAYCAVIERTEGELRTLQTAQRSAVKTAIAGQEMK